MIKHPKRKQITPNQTIPYTFSSSMPLNFLLINIPQSKLFKPLQLIPNIYSSTTFSLCLECLSLVYTFELFNWNQLHSFLYALSSNEVLFFGLVLNDASLNVNIIAFALWIYWDFFVNRYVRGLGLNWKRVTFDL